MCGSTSCCVSARAVGFAQALDATASAACCSTAGWRSRPATRCAAPATWCACRSARRCSAASSIRSAGRSTAAAPIAARAPRADRAAGARASSSAIWSPSRCRPACWSIDALFALGRGQRELIIGDRATGKTAIAIDAIINQKTSDMICVYVAVGQKTLERRGGSSTRSARHGAPERCIFVVAGAAGAPGLQWIAPFAGFTMAEYFRDRGRHALVVIDDLTKHAATPSRDRAADAPAAGPRGLSRRHLLPPCAAAGARRQAVGGSAAAARSPRCRSPRPTPAISAPISRPI